MRSQVLDASRPALHRLVGRAGAQNQLPPIDAPDRRKATVQGGGGEGDELLQPSHLILERMSSI
jgi:hypothetical protein